tara:strand:- start:6074 stop:9130 length:3057 start_codon:yes stop_codon:yes gene_type:complete
MYAELFCLSNFTFLKGASHPEELVKKAALLGYEAIAITDECSIAGIVRAYEEAKRRKIKLIIGSQFILDDGINIILLAKNKDSYKQICRLISHARRNSGKGDYRVNRKDFEKSLDDCIGLLLPSNEEQIIWFKSFFNKRGWIAISLLREGNDEYQLKKFLKWSSIFNIRGVAVGEVHMHARGRRALSDVLNSIRLRKPVSDLKENITINGEHHLRCLEDLKNIYPKNLLDETLNIASLCEFSLNQINYQYPDDITPNSLTSQEYLRQLTEEGIQYRWPEGCPNDIREQINYELCLINELKYESYFLTVWDIVRFARKNKILCQGRGSAANSAVCYCLGITEVDPSRMSLLFERFISHERNEPPDIDVDFENTRREEVIQYIYSKYGRKRAALAACVVTYRLRSAIRDVAFSLGFNQDQIEALVKNASGWRKNVPFNQDFIVEAGFNPDILKIKRLIILVNQIKGFPRHLSQHVGGFVITKDRLDELVPIENAAMNDRTVIQWEKSDLESLGFLKIDILALGMLSAIKDTLSLVNLFNLDTNLSLANIPAEDQETYEMIQKADTIGVFQIESRAQMSMLPRLMPNSFYDLVIQIAIVRPGPIQGDMVHPYLRRRQGKEKIDYPSEDVKDVLQRTLGVPIFQEQVIKLAMVAAGFNPGEADELRRTMAAWRRREGLESYRSRLMKGMLKNGYKREFAERIYHQILGFGEYGFPESHAASFALLVYVSAWLKCHYPAAFCAALINNQPMGFYQSAQLIQDARNHKVSILPIDVHSSDWDCTLESLSGKPILRLGLRMLKGLSYEAGKSIMKARSQHKFVDVSDLAYRAFLGKSDLKALAVGDALLNLSGHRYLSVWDVSGIERPTSLFDKPFFYEEKPLLKPPGKLQEVLTDYSQIGLSLRQHPLAFMRGSLKKKGILSAKQVKKLDNGCIVRIAGLVLIRQRPGKGRVVFVTLEDETGMFNLLIWSDLAERQKKVLLGTNILGATAEVQIESGVQYLICRNLEDHSGMLSELDIKTYNFK